MNNTIDDTFKLNFKSKCNLDSCHLCSLNAEGGKYEELISQLNSDNIRGKHFAVIELDEIHSENDAKILVSNLVGQDGKIREAVAFKINELYNNTDYVDFFICEEIFSILLEGIMDINGNVCRQIISGKWFESSDFITYLCNNLPERINKILNEIEIIDQKSKQYVISKRNFQLYWCLEALYNIINYVEFEKIKNIIQKTGNFYDYTIREKTAKIVAKLDNLELNELKEKLKNDDNYYVRRFLI